VTVAVLPEPRASASGKVGLMARLIATVVAASAILGLAGGSYARTKVREEPLDTAKGAKLASRIPCDGVTNPEDQVKLVSAFSAGTVEREFRIDVYEDKYCKRMDLGFKCLQEGKALWKEEWSVNNSHPQGETGFYGLASCADEGLAAQSAAVQISKDPPQIVLSGWYREPGADPNAPWKQAVLKKLDSRWETYEFTDPAGGTARIELTRR
jgi:hypothetical protein